MTWQEEKLYMAEEEEARKAKWAEIEKKLQEQADLSRKEPMPVKNELPAVWDLVIKDIKDRDEFGTKKYNTRLQPFNGRNVLVDLYQELLDAVVYVRQLIYENEHSNPSNPHVRVEK